MPRRCRVATSIKDWVGCRRAAAGVHHDWWSGQCGGGAYKLQQSVVVRLSQDDQLGKFCDGSQSVFEGLPFFKGSRAHVTQIGGVVPQSARGMSKRQTRPGGRLLKQQGCR